MQKEKIKKNKGFVILFAVMLSSIILAITLGVVDIAYKEIKFSTSVKDTNNAFFAADVGSECALFHDRVSNLFLESTAPTFSCNNISISTTESPSKVWTFNVAGLGGSDNACALVTVDKTDPTMTTIISKGYNDGCIPGNNTVERQIELTY
ncbi:MAG: hypothetical protein UR25_C0003G0019 [Candidatus Nomurabacteria bacterium GW2011_GWE1_32_28]|uniref:Type 4 fimbrial biogenesis protein PilX N-terminal domain-containing protein n=1 Tax=Candidatus Nomurabacteria bacterium GW2011_GWF1_31_48 TaxID=1618767 RepID=A0A0F9YUS9_9BACT|nr:MAG: hypothetical protein UR10_C0003G0019 [Candidatus Nomurabacteria bacterium GW2011_GWF2_30_133]KKP28659.1 MAG: hypothetical protein UR18_C0002G0071 [Candidatus Nomurabacteria bacterium GW2011_GWE2_31_40]KKP30236.1 MAG: hypothetical protein UR19_C0003G0072 [Candidatus Nomurabacteria bacterium GW2011_GWF1_31_48]KKP34763.1 MAG: hypothetical protein UR25_C0003G0019 [Candidatus Nomurabacteria bacterium GW2011_GWE1_32_28]HAS80779.1 hypothetical protein [Candidatus Nomurabacteria bacterium]